MDLTFGSYLRTPGAQLYFDLSSSDRVYITNQPAGLISGGWVVEGGLKYHAQYSVSQGVIPYGSGTAAPSAIVPPSNSVPRCMSSPPTPASKGRSHRSKTSILQSLSMPRSHALRKRIKSLSTSEAAATLTS